MDIPEISVVIPAYNAAGTIAGQLEALRNQVDSPTFEVVVADNRSTDGTAATARAAGAGLDLRVIDAARRQGVNSARNDGIRAARAEVIVLLDADDRADPRALRALLGALQADPAAGISTGLLHGQDPTGAALPVAQGHLPYAVGALLALRRAVFDQVGGFDESFRGGHDEVDFCWRAQHEGWTIRLVPQPLLHKTERTTARGAFRQYRRYGGTYVKLYAKHRAQGIRGSSARAEKPVLKRVLLQFPRLLRGQEERIDAAGFIGWHTGRWLGSLRRRTWGPK